MENEFAELTFDEEEETVLQAQIEPGLEKEERKANTNFMRIRVQLDVHYTLKRKKQLDHSDSFCEAKMTLEVEVVVMGWNFSLRAQPKKPLVMKSNWLIEDEEDDTCRNLYGEHNLEYRP
ncbi:hypothetical protein GOBAR_AA29226 [Gossypium barbadense]|uniref:Uncharacterized protein n=1 Tax=Gossypium barbadense TaxID=3634 RepID=A0A2P5WK79_GOSBA|nr:hypothetical protein GOBAR_AA29226 [Gossypium barbadense]